MEKKSPQQQTKKSPAQKPQKSPKQTPDKSDASNAETFGFDAQSGVGSLEEFSSQTREATKSLGGITENSEQVLHALNTSMHTIPNPMDSERYVIYIYYLIFF